MATCTLPEKQGTGRNSDPTKDSIGRMLTRTVLWEGGVEVTNPVAATFEWDGWDLVREVDAEGEETVYYAPLGEILSFKRESSVYQVQADALGSVRTVTDSMGAPMANLDYDAWGGEVASSGSLAASVSRRFIGTLGVITDDVVGLDQMRNRWYDAKLGSFISRDAVRNFNRMAYARGNPVSLIEPLGLQSEIPHLDPSKRRVVEGYVDQSPLFSKNRAKWLRVIRCLIWVEGYNYMEGVRDDLTVMTHWSKNPGEEEVVTSGSVRGGVMGEKWWDLAGAVQGPWTDPWSRIPHVFDPPEEYNFYTFGVFQINLGVWAPKIPDYAARAGLKGYAPNSLGPLALAEVQIPMGLDILADKVSEVGGVDPGDASSLEKLVNAFQSTCEPAFKDCLLKYSWD